jgi:DNA-binding transcriptional ArsR family regulator
MANLVFRTLKMFTHAYDLRVMMALLEEVDYENKIIICQADIARDLGMQRSNVSSAIKRLVEAGLILKDSKKGVTCFYRLSPEFGWKGSAKNHITAKREYRAGQRKTVAEEQKAP